VIARIARRLVWAVFVVWAVTSLTFVINNVLPGDPARLVAGPQASPEDVAQIRKNLALDEPLLVQYGAFMGRLLHTGPWDIPKDSADHASCAPIFPGLHVDFGTSFRLGQPVVKIIGDRVPRTLSLAFFAMLVQLLIGVGFGAFAANRPGSARDRATMGLSLLGSSAPTFLLGIALQFVFAFKLGVLPFDGYGQSFVDHAKSIVLPALTLGVYGAAYYTRLVRDEMAQLLAQDYARTARAKGAGPGRVLFFHGLRNALLPLVTAVGMDLGVLVGGAIVTERIFRWPGLGMLSVDSLLNRDGPVLLGIVVVTSTAVVVSTLIVDVLYAIFDPRTLRASA